MEHRDDRGGLFRGTLGNPLAPLHWLERAKGRWRIALLALYSLIALALGVLGWRAVSLRDLPDLGDPFDVEAFCSIRVPDDQNAFVLYRKATERLKPLAREEANSLNLNWSQSSPAVKQWLGDNREALGLWLQGSERTSGLYLPPRELSIETPLPVAQTLRDFSRLGVLEGSRREQAGDMEGAWRMYRAVLRSSRHLAQHGGAIQRLIAMAMLRTCVEPITRWLADPRVDAAMLRRALADLRACGEATPPVSEMLKMEYLIALKAIDGPHDWLLSERSSDVNWYPHLPGYLPVRDFLYREPERSRRLVRIVFTNWLAHCDEPRSQRPKLVGENIALYEATSPGGGVPTLGGPSVSLPGSSVRSMSLKAIDDWLATADLARILLPGTTPLIGILDSDRSVVGALTVQIAETLHEREHGAPPKSLGELVGPYLDRLPEGYEATSEPIPLQAPDPGKKH